MTIQTDFDIKLGDYLQITTSLIIIDKSNSRKRPLYIKPKN